MKTRRCLLAAALTLAAACSAPVTAPDAAPRHSGGGMMGSGTYTDPAPRDSTP